MSRVELLHLVLVQYIRFHCFQAQLTQRKFIFMIQTLYNEMTASQQIEVCYIPMAFRADPNSINSAPRQDNQVPYRTYNNRPSSTVTSGMVQEPNQYQ